MTDPTVAVVIAAHNEAAALPSLLPELLLTLERSQVTPAIYVVDDGSTDATAEIVLAARERDTRIHLIQLSRNFGHQAALMAGLQAAPGDAVICMDGDGQHPPPVLEELIDAWRAGADVVHTLRIDSADVGRAKRLTGRSFYRLFRWLTGLDLADGMADFRLLSRVAVDATLTAVGNRPFFRGAAVWIGFEQASVRFEARDRATGTSSYSLRRMARLGRDGIVGFSVRPLWLLSTVGLLGSVLAFLIASYAIVVGIVNDRAAPGWASTIAFTAALQGLVFVLLGAFGVYIGAIFAEVLNRPPFIVAAKNGARSVDGARTAHPSPTRGVDARREPPS